MSLLSRLSSLWRNLAHRGRAERALDAEVRSYIELLTDEKVRAGMSPRAARRAALLELGGVEQVKEEVRDVRAGAILDTLGQDLRYGARALARAPGFTGAAVLALALGIGASAAVFSVVNAVLLRPLPYKEPERLAVILHHGTGPTAPANYLDWERQSRAFEAMGAAEWWTPNLSGDRPEKLFALRLTPSMFSVLGVRPLLGRVFLTATAQPASDREVILSHRLWQRRFGGEPQVLGSTITLDGEQYTVVGVMPKEFRFAPFWATRAEMWAPLDLAPAQRTVGASVSGSSAGSPPGWRSRRHRRR
jgi:hypothetical protein